MPSSTEPTIPGKIASSEETPQVIRIEPPAPLEESRPIAGDIFAPLGFDEKRVDIDPVDPVSQAILVFKRPKPGLTFEDQQAAGLILANEIIRRDLTLTASDLHEIRNRIAAKISELAETQHEGSLREMERKTGISNAYLGDLIKLNKSPGLNTLYQLSISYDIPVQVFLSEAKFRKRPSSPKTVGEVVSCLQKHLKKILKSHPDQQLSQLLPNLDGGHLPKLETLWMTAQKLNLTLGDLLP